MTKEEAIECAKNMTYREAVRNTVYAKGVKYKKATRIKLQELAEIADKLVLCKDCRASRVYGKTTQWLACEMMEGQATDPDGYCYLGERKEHGKHGE